MGNLPEGEAGPVGGDETLGSGTHEFVE
jgi:hypothetical protein